MQMMDPSRYNALLKDRIHSVFSGSVLPRNILPVIKKYNPHVLTTKDMDYIRSVTLQRGNMTGAEELLDYMVRYSGWFECLLKALQDPEVKLNHVAVEINTIKENLDVELRQRQCHVEPQRSQAWINHESGVPRNDFAVEPEGPENVSDEDDSDRQEGQAEGGGVDPDYPMNGDNEGDNGCAQAMRITRQASHKPATHGEDYDFSREETENGLSTIAGWHGDINSNTVNSRLQPYLEKNGHFLIWYWSQERRPAISVTYNGRVKTFLIHKKPSKTVAKYVKYYFIVKQQQLDSSLYVIVQFHLRHGIFCNCIERGSQEGEAIPLLTPVLP